MEKRRHPRADMKLVVSYRVSEEVDNTDISQTKNVSLGGMLLTTNKYFKPGTQLAVGIRLLADAHPINLLGRVVESREVVKNLIYDTRLEILSIDKEHKEMLKKAVEKGLGKT